MTFDKYENDFLRFFGDFGKEKIKSVDNDVLESFIRSTIGEMELTNKAYAGLRTLLMGFQTGVRVGELVALKFSDVHEDTLHVQRQEIKYKDANG